MDRSNLQKEADTERERALRNLEQAIRSGNLKAQRPTGDFADIRQTKFATKNFGSKKEMCKYIYRFLHGGTVFRPEVDVMNPAPGQYYSDYLFPRDTYLIKEGQAVIDTPEDELEKKLDWLFGKKKVPFISFVAGLDDKDVKRVCMILGEQSLICSSMSFSFSGGVANEEIQKVLNL